MGNKPLLSWRVALLPYLGHDALYKRFKLDEPWDGPNNKKLREEMPSVYGGGSGDKDRTKARTQTYYRAFVGKGTALEGDRGVRLTEFPDGLSNTAVAVEAGEPVPWTKPEDLPYEAGKPLPRLGGLFGGRFHVLMADGTVSLLKPDFKQEALRAAITRNGGEVVSLPD
jgi:hypothetical protein